MTFRVDFGELSRAVVDEPAIRGVRQGNCGGGFVASWNKNEKSEIDL